MPLGTLKYLKLQALQSLHAPSMFSVAGALRADEVMSNKEVAVRRCLADRRADRITQQKSGPWLVGRHFELR